jgi:hypothetical protein
MTWLMDFFRVRSLCIVLGDVDCALAEQHLSDQQKQDLKEINESCEDTLQDLEKTLQNYYALAPNANAKGLQTKLARTWKKLQWEPEDIKELRSRSIANVSLLDAFCGQITRKVLLRKIF